MISTNHSSKKHEVLIIQRDKEILLVTPCGKEIASLKVETMENSNGEPTDNFWVRFTPKDSDIGKEFASVYL